MEVGQQVQVHIATVNGSPQLVGGVVTRISVSGRRFKVACDDGAERNVHACNIAEFAQDTWLDRARGVA